MSTIIMEHKMENDQMLGSKHFITKSIDKSI